MTTVTEFEAGQMWCPEVRRLYADEDGSGAGINRRSEFEPEKIASCIASRCMFWRWGKALRVAKGADYTSGEPTGYCGKGGPPE